MDETEDAPGHFAEQERNAGACDERLAGSLFNAVEVVLGRVFETRQKRLAEVLRRHEDWVGVKAHLTERIRPREVVADRPLGFEDAQSAHVVVSAQERDIRVEEFRQNPDVQLEDLLARGERGRHELLCDLTHQLVEATLVEEGTLAGGLGGDLAEQAAEGLHDGELSLGPDTTVASDNERPDDLAADELDGLDENAPLDVADGPGE